MTHDEIAAFLMIVSCGSMSTAAEKLYITQPALSNRIRLLEEDLGFALIKRRKGSRSLELTDEGKAFLPLARQNDRMWQEAMAIPYRMAKDSLRVSCIMSVADYIMTRVVPVYCRLYPEVNLSIMVSSSYESYRKVEDGELDLAFVSPEMYSRTIETFPAYRSSMVCVSPEAAGLPETVSMSMLDPHRELRITWSPEFDNWHDNVFAGFSKPTLLTNSFRNLEYSMHGDYWALIPYILADRLYTGGKRISRINNPPPDQRVFCLTRSDGPNDNIRSFLRCFHEDIQNTPGTVSYLDKVLG